MKKFFRDTMFSILDFYITRKMREAGLMSDDLIILNLHRVSPAPNAFWEPLHPEVFDALLEYLKESFEVTTFSQLKPRNGEKTKVILSFDDAYADFKTHALPILNKHSLPCNQNVICSAAQTGERLWNIKLYDWLNSVEFSKIQSLEIDGFAVKMLEDSYTARARFGLRLSSYLKKLSLSQRTKILEPHKNLFDSISESKKTNFMRVEDIKQLPDSVEIGCHSFSHESMGNESLEFFKNDFAKAELFFANELKRDLSIYAFPNGSYTKEQVDFLKEKNLKAILLVDNWLSAADKKIHPRITFHARSAREARVRAIPMRII